MRVVRVAVALLLVGAYGLLMPQDAVGQFMCPDGSYVSRGPCTLCPNGRYVGGGATCQLTPDGSYVPQTRGAPQIAPDGSFHPSGRLILCPDGSYVTGTRCVLTPSGGYVGR